MLPLTAYRHFGLISFLILLVGLAFVIIKWTHGRRMTFSQHVAMQKSSTYYYIILFSIVLPLLLLFFIYWFTPIFHLPIWFNVFVTIAAIAQYICTIIPEIDGWKAKYHRILAGISGIFLIPPLVILLSSHYISDTSKIIILLGLFCMITVVFTLIAGKAKQYEPSYIHQSAYYCAFFIPILAANYL